MNNYVLTVISPDGTESSYPPCWGLNKSFGPNGTLTIEVLERDENDEMRQGTVIRFPEDGSGYTLTNMGGAVVDRFTFNELREAQG